MEDQNNTNEEAEIQSGEPLESGIDKPKKKEKKDKDKDKGKGHNK